MNLLIYMNLDILDMLLHFPAKSDVKRYHTHVCLLCIELRKMANI